MSDLNENQKKAVSHMEGPLLVLAGAGSGKTRVVTRRIATLIEKGIPAKNILAVTFTNKAAKEMQRRVKKLTSFDVWTSTFHSLSATLLRSSLDHFGYSKNFVIYDEKDSLALLKRCLKELSIDEKKLKSIKSKISNAKNDLIEEFKDEKIEATYSLYQRRLKESNALDFDDLLSISLKLLRTDKDVRDRYQERFKFILIDEYQDINNAQYELTKILSKKYKNLFVVGDPDQSIYSWRGANYQNILNFKNDFPTSLVINLEENYRSTENILFAANSLIEKNRNRLKKSLWSSLGRGEKIKIFQSEDEKEEAKFVVDSLSHYIKNGTAIDDIAIFYRTNAQSRKLEDLLISRKIPYIIYGGISFYQRKEIKDLLSYLRAAENGRDLVSFIRSVNLPKRGIGMATIEKLAATAEKRGVPIISLCQEAIENGELKLTKKQKASLGEYLSIIYQIREAAKMKRPISSIIHDLIDRSNYLEYLKEDMESYQGRFENVEELILKAEDFKERSLSSFLEELTLFSTIQGVERNSVKLMTLHNAKGLEFSLVYITGMEENLFPHINSKNSQEEIEEERRLFYVGITRAKRFLYLTHSSWRYIHGMEKIQMRSRFLKEIDSSYIEEVRKQPFLERV